jgi:hypothetical protein
MTVASQITVYINMPICIGPFTFRNKLTGQIINLTSDFVAVSVRCDVKRKGTPTADANMPAPPPAPQNENVYTTMAAVFVNQAAGVVQVPSYTFTQVGDEWEYQFVAINASGVQLQGEPVTFRTIPNVANVQINVMA